MPVPNTSNDNDFEAYVGNRQLGMEPNGTNKVWANEFRGFLLTKHGLSRTGFHLSGIEVFENELWASRPKYVGVQGRFFVEPEPIEGSTSVAEATKVGTERIGGEFINEADYLIHEFDYMVSTSQGSFTPGVAKLNEIEPQKKVRFMLSTDEIDFGEPDAVKQIYVAILTNNCKHDVLCSVERKMPGQEWELSDDFVRCQPGQAAGFSVAGSVFIIHWWVDQYTKFKGGKVRLRHKLVDFRQIHGQPTIIVEATE